MPKPLDPQTKKHLASRVKYYKEMGIYDFYRRPVEEGAELALQPVADDPPIVGVSRDSLGVHVRARCDLAEVWHPDRHAVRAAIEESAQLASNGTSDTDRAFDRALIQVIVQRALARLRQQYVEAGEEKVFTHLELSVVGERQRTYYAAVSKVVGKSVPLLKKEQYVAKEDWLMRYRGCLREELAALGVRRACIERVMEELLDASR